MRSMDQGWRVPGSAKRSCAMPFSSTRRRSRSWRCVCSSSGSAPKLAANGAQCGRNIPSGPTASSKPPAACEYPESKSCGSAISLAVLFIACTKPLRPQDTNPSPFSS